jgi:hypothetical protein
MHRLGVLAVHLAVGAPVRGLEVAERRQVVKQRPDDLVREAQVEVAHLGFAQRHADERVTGIAAHRAQRRGEFLRRARRAGPAHPRAAAVAQHRQQRRNQSAARRVGVPAVRSTAVQGKGQPVRDDDQPSPDSLAQWLTASQGFFV